MKNESRLPHENLQGPARCKRAAGVDLREALAAFPPGVHPARRPTFPLPTPAASLVLTRSARRSHCHAKDQEVRCETFQSVRPGQAHASLSGNPAPRQSKIPEAEAPPRPGQSPGRRPCRAAQTLPAVQPLNAHQPQLRQAGDSQGDPPATSTTLITCLVSPTPPRRASAAKRC